MLSVFGVCLAYLIVSRFLDAGRNFVLQCPELLQFQNADILFISYVGQVFRKRYGSYEPGSKYWSLYDQIPNIEYGRWVTEQDTPGFLENRGVFATITFIFVRS
jgi:hypothetical protein